MGTSNGREAWPRWRAGLSRRAAERYPVRAATVDASWLRDARKISETGVLIDISAGGFCARLFEAPASGHLLHARLFLNPAQVEEFRVVEVDARVCGRTLPGQHADTVPDWLVHFAFESIRPADEKRMAQAIGLLSAARS